MISLLYPARSYQNGLTKDQTPQTNAMPQEVLLGKIFRSAAPTHWSFKSPLVADEETGSQVSNMALEGLMLNGLRDLYKGPLRDIHSFKNYHLSQNGI